MADSDDDLQFQNFDSYFSGLPQATTPVGTAPIMVFQGTTKQAPATIFSSRQVLMSTTNYFVAAPPLGNDANPGTQALPWATLQKAMNFLSVSIDFGGQVVNVNAGPGTFAGVDFLSTVGGGWLNFLGSGSGVTTVTQAASNLGVFSLNITGITCNVGFDAMTASSSSQAAIFYMGFPACTATIGNAFTFVADDIILHGGSTSAVIGLFFSPNTLFVGVKGTNNIRVTGTWDRGWWTDAAAVISDFGTWQMVGTPTFNRQFSFLDVGGEYTSNGQATYSGAANGQRFQIINNSAADAADPTGTFFPGNSAGILRSGGEYTGITDYFGNVSGLPTPISGAHAFVNDAAANPVFSATPTGGSGLIVPVYGDGTNWRYG